MVASSHAQCEGCKVHECLYTMCCHWQHMRLWQRPACERPACQDHMWCTLTWLMCCWSCCNSLSCIVIPSILMWYQTGQAASCPDHWWHGVCGCGVCTVVQMGAGGGVGIGGWGGCCMLSVHAVGCHCWLMLCWPPGAEQCCGALHSRPSEMNSTSVQYPGTGPCVTSSALLVHLIQHVIGLHQHGHPGCRLSLW